MRPLRPLLHAILALSLMVQGVAFASGIPSEARDLLAQSADPAAATAGQDADSPIPCHAQPAPAAPASASHCDCCGTDASCADMGGCAFAHAAAIVPSGGLQFDPTRDVAIASRDRSAQSVPPQLLLRPPISRA